MTDISGKILQWLLGVLLAISTLLGILFYADVISDDVVMYWAYILVGLTALITIVAPIIYFLFNLKSAIKFLITIGAMIILAIIAYALAGNEFTALQLEDMKSTVETSKLVGTGLIFTYFLACLTVLSIVYASISKIFK